MSLSPIYSHVLSLLIGFILGFLVRIWTEKHHYKTIVATIIIIVWSFVVLFNTFSGSTTDYWVHAMAGATIGWLFKADVFNKKIDL